MRKDDSGNPCFEILVFLGFAIPEAALQFVIEMHLEMVAQSHFIKDRRGTPEKIVEF